MALGDYEGRRDAGHLRRWQDALNAGRARLPRCTATTRAGTPCRCHALTGSDKCHWHLRGAERRAHDLKAIPRYQRLARLSDIGEVGRRKAARALETIENRQLLHLWKTVDPTIPGALRVLNPHDEKRVMDFLLKQYDLDFDRPLPETGRLPSAYCVDQLRRGVILFLQEKIPRKKLATRIRRARARDREWYAQLDAIETIPLDLLKP